MLMEIKKGQCITVASCPPFQIWDDNNVELFDAVITKVGRKYFELESDLKLEGVRFLIETQEVDERGLNYRLFDTKKSYYEGVRRAHLLLLIGEALLVVGSELPLGKLESIADLIGIEDNLYRTSGES